MRRDTRGTPTAHPPAAVQSEAPTVGGIEEDMMTNLELEELRMAIRDLAEAVEMLTHEIRKLREQGSDQR